MKEEKSIQNESKQCVVFHHEDYGSQLSWALQHYVSVHEEGTEDSLFAGEHG